MAKGGGFVALIAALVAATGSATGDIVFEEPLPYNLYDGVRDPDCLGDPQSPGIINSVSAMGDGTFCERWNDDYFGDVEMYTKVKYSSCEAVGSSGIVVLDLYECSDSACTQCEEPTLGMEMTAPTIEPLPAVDWCFAFEWGDDSGILKNRFDASADAGGVEDYWRFYVENSCLGDTAYVENSCLGDTAKEKIVFDKPLPWNVFDGTENPDCGGFPRSSGTIKSVSKIGDGKFCRETEVFTRLDYSSCETVGDSGTVLVDVYRCQDSTCAQCDGGVPYISGVEMTAPTRDPLPAIDWCFAFEGEVDLGKLNVRIQFDASADAGSVEDYWRFNIENSCLKDVSSMSDAPSFVFASEDIRPSEEDMDVVAIPSAAGFSADQSKKTGFVTSLAVFLVNFLTHDGP